MASVKALDPRFPLETCDKKEDAIEWMGHYASILVEKGLQQNYGIFIKRIPQKHKPIRLWPWGVFVDQY